eukprot:CAMPEP_0182518104 /NCGR_PEP_ID=MMETSP1321-20130603/43561_1 /TAXON_ID=91990 /ORGANISM="Bolidomonas sp., Strain RCC1657" /LENGTH=113 /DNA_ID=CAMNT_0024725937 /DNA_START=61 /DNA_END=402 /DNA_ORIENTATION=+
MPYCEYMVCTVVMSVVGTVMEEVGVEGGEGGVGGGEGGVGGGGEGLGHVGDAARKNRHVKEVSDILIACRAVPFFERVVYSLFDAVDASGVPGGVLGEEVGGEREFGGGVDVD